MSNLYYGIHDPPKGKKRANMKQSFDKGQVRYYGVEPLDDIYLEKSKDGKKDDDNFSQKEKMMIALAVLNGKKKKIKGMLQSLSSKSKDNEKRELYNKDLANVNKHITDLKAIINEEKIKITNPEVTKMGKDLAKILQYDAARKFLKKQMPKLDTLLNLNFPESKAKAYK